MFITVGWGAHSCDLLQARQGEVVLGARFPVELGEFIKIVSQ